LFHLKKTTMSKKIITLIALAASMNAVAQQDTSKSSNLDEVVITATKFPIKTSATGKVITVITQQQLEQSGGKDLAEILNEQTGLIVGGANSNAGKDKSIYLRGAAVQYTLITVDGVPMYDPSGIGGNFDIRNLAINLVERIEVLKGSQSTLYGSDAVAGVINIITKKAATNKQIAVNGLVSYGSNNTLKANAGVSGKTRGVDYNFGYSYFKTDGINEAISTSDNADKDGYKQQSFQANFGFHPTKNIVVKPYMRYGYIKGSIDQGGFIDELDYSYSQKSFQAGVKNEFTFGKTKLHILYNFNKIERDYTDDSTLSQNGYDRFSKGSYTGNEHFVDAFANFELCKSTKLTVGIDYRASQSNQKYLSLGFFGPYKTNYSSDSLIQYQTSVYAALNYANSEGFNIEIGGRYNNHSVYGGNGVFNINPCYQVTDDVKVFANISSAYRTPSLYQLYSEYGNKNLKPEIALTAELGIQQYFENKKIKTQIVLFSRRINDVMYFYTNYTTYASQYINQDKQKDLGAEFDASFEIVKNTTLKAFYTFVDGQISTKKIDGKDTSFNNLLRRPQHSIGLNFSSQVTKQLLVSANVNWFGKRNDAYFNNNTFKTDYVTLDSYTLIDLYAEYGFLNNKLKVFANARNIANTKYTEISGYNTLGFNAYGGIRFNF